MAQCALFLYRSSGVCLFYQVLSHGPVAYLVALGVEDGVAERAVVDVNTTVGTHRDGHVPHLPRQPRESETLMHATLCLPLSAYQSLRVNLCIRLSASVLRFNFMDKCPPPLHRLYLNLFLPRHAKVR